MKLIKLNEDETHWVSAYYGDTYIGVATENNHIYPWGTVDFWREY